MAEIASAHVSIFPKFAPGFSDGIKKEVGAAGTKGGTSFSKGFGASATKGMGSAMTGVKAGIVGLLASVSVGAAVAGFKEVTGAASDLSETVNKSRVIFGAQAAGMEKWASTAATSLGMSKQAALESAAGFGNMFTQLGFTGDASAKMSQQVIQMATDMGSFNNLPTAEVADMISAAFRGEYDSLQRLVPTINAAAVEQEAMAMTGKKNAKSLTLQEKAAATMSLVTKGAAVSVGDFGKTAEGAANKAKIMAAQTEDLKAKFGALLAPMQGVANDGFAQLLDAGNQFTEWLGRNPEVIEGFVAALSLIGDVLKAVAMVVLPVLAVLTEGFSQFMKLIGDMFYALGTVPGFEWATAAGDKLYKAADGAHAAAKGMESLTLEMWNGKKSALEMALQTANLTDTLHLVPALTEAKVLAPGAKPSKAEVDAFIATLGTIPPEKKAEIVVAANTYGVQVVKDAMASVYDKVVNLTVRTTYTGGSYMLPGGAADGGLIHGYAPGGRVSGWSPHDRADNIPAWLTAGEFVQPVRTVEHYGAEAMEAVRQRRAVISYADGGGVGPGSRRSAGASAADIRAALDGLRVDIDNGRLFFRRELAVATGEAGRTARRGTL